MSLHCFFNCKKLEIECEYHFFFLFFTLKFFKKTEKKLNVKIHYSKINLNYV